MTDALIEKVARTMCMRNGQQECFRLPCTEDTCTGWQDFAEDARAALAAIEASETHAVIETAHIKELFRQLAILMREMGLNAEADELDAAAGIDTRETP